MSIYIQNKIKGYNHTAPTQYFTLGYFRFYKLAYFGKHSKYTKS